MPVRPDQPQLPPSVICCGSSPAHVRVQLSAPAQLIEQLAVQVTLQLEPASHVMLLDAPTVMSQLAPALQSTLHDEPHEPLQVAS